MIGLDTPTTNLTFELAIPQSWQEFDLNPASRDAAVAGLVERHLATLPNLTSRRSEIQHYVCGVVRDAWDNGARYCATFVEPAADGLIMGSLTVSVLPPIKASGSSSVTDLLT
ncbi:MAG: hypothetical protein LBG70_01125, partial [Bifidobacteriaceae bacterium]|nr:hypothetical protein [Bifidobacteriaceae bacterium]